MINGDGNGKGLAKYRIEQAHECLQSAEREIEAGVFKGAANRSYYAIFHAMRAVLALQGIDSKKHSGVIAAFRQNYIKTGEFELRFSDIIRDAFEVRNSSDYQDFYVPSKSDVEQQIENAKMFLEEVEKYLKIKGE